MGSEMDNGSKFSLAVAAVVVLFTSCTVFAYVWDALVKGGALEATTISEAVHDQLERQVSLAFLLGYLVCHLIRG